MLWPRLGATLEPSADLACISIKDMTSSSSPRAPRPSEKLSLGATHGIQKLPRVTSSLQNALRRSPFPRTQHDLSHAAHMPGTHKIERLRESNTTWPLASGKLTSTFLTGAPG